MFCWPCISIHPCNENQPDARFILSLFRQSTSTCFGHVCSPPSGSILYIYNSCYVLCFNWLSVGQPSWFFTTLPKVYSCSRSYGFRNQSRHFPYFTEPPATWPYPGPDDFILRHLRSYFFKIYLIPVFLGKWKIVLTVWSATQNNATYSI
jgi:hypothetical protein